MINSFQIKILTLSREVGYLFWVWMNSVESRKQQLFSVNLKTSHNQTFIGLRFSGNIFHWSKFKARSHDILFSWTFYVLLINSCKHLYIKEILYINKNPRGTQSWNRYKYVHIFTFHWYWCWKVLLFFSCRVKIPY